MMTLTNGPIERPHSLELLHSLERRPTVPQSLRQLRAEARALSAYTQTPHALLQLGGTLESGREPQGKYLLAQLDELTQLAGQLPPTGPALLSGQAQGLQLTVREVWTVDGWVVRGQAAPLYACKLLSEMEH